MIRLLCLVEEEQHRNAVAELDTRMRSLNVDVDVFARIQTWTRKLNGLNIDYPWVMIRFCGDTLYFDIECQPSDLNSKMEIIKQTSYYRDAADNIGYKLEFTRHAAVSNDVGRLGVASYLLLTHHEIVMY